MSFPRYPTYKPSGVEWLGEVPEHWQEKPLKTITSINDEVLPESLSRDYEIEYVDIGSVSLANGIEKTEAMLFGDAPSRARRIPRDGDVLVSTVRTYLKAIAPVVNPPSNLVASTGFAVVRPRHELEPGFLKYALQEEHFIQQVISRSTGVSYPAINASDVAKISLNLPGSSEQLAIATFLDHETAKIDALIAEQQRLIELLQEKRQAVISHAVTKGLNPDVPMKDSGVEWLGEVPEHWEVMDLVKTIAVLQTGPFGSQLGTSDYEDEGIAIINPSNICDESIDTSNGPFISASKASELERHKLHKEDLVIARRGELGRCAVIEEIEEQKICGTGSILLRPLEWMSSRYIAHVIRSDYIRASLSLNSVGSTMENLNTGIVGKLRIPVPPRDEQGEIVNEIIVFTANSENLVDNVLKAVLLLQERRSALISAAVTGQIDVRGLVPEAEAA